MHESALIASILSIVDEKLQQNNLERLTSIKLLVGEYSGAIPDALRFAFIAAVADTVHKDATLEIEEIPAEAECRFCKAVFKYEAGMTCPECEGIAPKLIKGDELRIEYLDAE